MALDCPNIRLKYNSTGDDVKQMQTLLQTLGYYTGYKVDGKWGDGTEQAVRAFQQRYGLDVDGIFGEKTCTKLTSLTKAVSKEGAVFDCENTSLKYGSTDTEKVTILQKYLKDWGYYTGVVDGDFKTVTENAVKAFQKDTGHDPDGWFGKKTCPDFVKRVQNESKTQTESTPYIVGDCWNDIPPSNRHLYAELRVLPRVIVETEETITTINEADSTTESETTTEYDEETGEEIEIETQTVTPQVKETTVKRMSIKRIYPSKSSGGNVKGTFNCDGMDLHPGSSGDQVKTLQTGLKQLNYYNGTVDGSYGPVTEAAVKALQNASGSLLADGLFGPATCRVFNLKIAALSGGSEDDLSYTDDEVYICGADMIVGFPTFAWDAEGLTMEANIRLLWENDILDHIRLMQQATINYYNGEWWAWDTPGYISDIQLVTENSEVFVDVKLVGYTAFLEQQLAEYTGTKPRLTHLEDILSEAGLDWEIDLMGMPNDEFTIDATKTDSTGTATGDSGGGGTVQMSNADCNPSDVYESDRWADHRCNPPRCTAKSKVAHGNSSRSYATDTASHNSSVKELVEFVEAKCQYQKYGDNPKGSARCPEAMWNAGKTGKIVGNCADFARLMKCIFDVNGYKAIICHIPGHFYNAVWENGGWTLVDICARTCWGLPSYGHANHGNIKPTGTWDNPQPRLWY